MFTPVTHGSHAAFFEIAATLIPILLFGGVVAERLRPRSDDSLSRIHNHALFIPVLGSLAVVAEVTAIVSVVLGTSDWWSRLIVAAALTLGLLAIVISLWLPWVDELRKRKPSWAHRVVWLSAVLLLLSFIVSVRLMTAGVSTETDNERIDAYLQAQTHSDTARSAALNRGTSLIAASGRAQQQRIAAEARHETPKVIAGLRAQEKRLLTLAVGSTEWLGRLELEAANLYREMIGIETLHELPRKAPMLQP